MFEGPVLTRADRRWDYGEERFVSIGMVEEDCYVVVHTCRGDLIRLEDDLSDKNIRRATLAELRAMKERGELRETRDTGFREELPPGFWEEAKLINFNQPRSVHLKLDPEVFDFFKAQGKGHLTRMQNVLKAYVRAHKRP